MNYAEFDSQMKPLESQVADLEMQRDRIIKEQEKVCKAYLEACAIPLNAKVEVTEVRRDSYEHPERTHEIKTICFIAGRKIVRKSRFSSAKNDICYTFHKAKKDGTMSQIRQYFWGDSPTIKQI